MIRNGMVCVGFSELEACAPGFEPQILKVCPAVSFSLSTKSSVVGSSFLEPEHHKTFWICQMAHEMFFLHETEPSSEHFFITATSSEKKTKTHIKVCSVLRIPPSSLSHGWTNEPPSLLLHNCSEPTQDGCWMGRLTFPPAPCHRI